MTVSLPFEICGRTADQDHGNTCPAAQSGMFRGYVSGAGNLWDMTAESTARDSDESAATAAVRASARAARGATTGLANAANEVIDAALGAMADRLQTAADAVLEAN